MYEQMQEEIKQHILDGTVNDEDQDKALEIYEKARQLWDAHAWLRALGGAATEIDTWMINFLKREIALEERVTA